ncbi:MAG: TIR domain-containing protein [Chloroflexi bacterium]|nr:TIR domain-containing protein [Chloroflexota bacterium]
MSHVFISYSKKNRPYARQLAEHLLQQGFRVWIDERIEYGENWWKEIVAAIQNCAVFIVIMTPDSEQSRWVEREVALAEHYRKPLFPLLLAGENWPLFVLTQYVDVRDGKLPDEALIDRLAEIAPRQAGGGEDVTGSLLSETAAPLQPVRKQARHRLLYYMSLAIGSVALVIVTLVALNAAGVFEPAVQASPTTEASDTPDGTTAPTRSPSATPAVMLRTRARPILPSDKLLSVEGEDIGIVGPFVRGLNQQTYLVTAFHPPGTVVMQPGENRSEDVRIGEFIEVSNNSPLAQLLGLVKLDDNVQLASFLSGMQPLQGVSMPTMGTQVHIASQTNVYVTGKVEAVNVSVGVGLGEGTILDLNGVARSLLISQPGDQGGLVVDERGAIIGVIVGANARHSIIAPISHVLQAFDVELIEQVTDCSSTLDAALEIICEDATYAVVFLNHWFDARRSVPPIILLEEEINNAYWDNGSYYVSPSVQYLPDVVYQLSSTAYLYDVVLLENRGQAGAIFRSYREVFASVIRQNRLGQTAETADWILAPGSVAWARGDDVSRTTDLSPWVSLKAPGTAYDDSGIGKDPQVAHMDELAPTSDGRETRINSGIPNKAFYETAIQIGSDRALTIWYQALFRLKTDSDFQHLAAATYSTAGTLFGSDSEEKRAVAAAWQKVGVVVT